jgi:hypothetical protein
VKTIHPAKRTQERFFGLADALKNGFLAIPCAGADNLKKISK